MQYVFHIVMLDVIFLSYRRYYITEVIILHTRIRKKREEMGYTREIFAEKLDVSVSYLAELERGRTGISVKMLVKVCKVLGLSADYVLFGEERNADAKRLDRIHRIDNRYLPLLDSMIAELLALSIPQDE